VGRFLDVSTYFHGICDGHGRFVTTPTSIIGAGGPATSRARSKLADWRWRDHEGSDYPYWGSSRLFGQLAAHPTTESLCGAATPAHSRIAVVGLLIT
jgi:hypothetical protein